MRMERVDGVAVPAGGTVRFAPGGYHLMLFGLKPGMRSVPLTFGFASGGTVQAVASVEAMAGMGHDQH